jgi:hypothetical protein
MIDLSFELQSRGFITGSLTEKSVKKAKKEPPFTSKKARKARKTNNKTEDLKILLIYLLNNEDFFDCMANEFFENWKPLIDKGCFSNER